MLVLVLSLLFIPIFSADNNQPSVSDTLKECNTIRKLIDKITPEELAKASPEERQRYLDVKKRFDQYETTLVQSRQSELAKEHEKKLFWNMLSALNPFSETKKNDHGKKE